MSFMSENPIKDMVVKDGETNHFFYLMLLYIFVFQHITCDLMVCHVSKKRYSPFNNKLFVFYVIAIFFIYCLNKMLVGQIFVPNYIYGLLCIVVFCQWHYILCVINEIADALGIKILKVKPYVDDDEEQRRSNDFIL